LVNGILKNEQPGLPGTRSLAAIRLPAFFIILLAALGGWVPRAWAQCTPTSATLYADADDELNLWVNGNLITTTPVSFVNAASGTIPSFSIPVGDFVAGTNLIAADNINQSNSVVMASWVIDVTCSGGQHAYFSNTDSCYKIYDDANGSAPPTMSGGLSWYQASYPATAVFNGTPVQVSAASVSANDPYLKPMYSPQTGQLQPFTSIASTGLDNSANENIYYRGLCPLTAQTYVPPSFTIQKIPGVTSFPSTSNYSSTAPYTIVVCNSGAPVNSPVTVWDQMLGGVGGNYTGPYWSYPTNPYSASSVSGGALFTFPQGFGGDGTCVTMMANISNFNTSTGCTVLNAAGVSWAGTPQPTTTAGVPVVCSTNTFTSTPTKTPTFTPPATPTNSPTPTPSFTPTKTFTPTNSPADATNP